MKLHVPKPPPPVETGGSDIHYSDNLNVPDPPPSADISIDPEKDWVDIVSQIIFIGSGIITSFCIGYIFRDIPFSNLLSRLCQ